MRVSPRTQLSLGVLGQPGTESFDAFGVVCGSLEEIAVAVEPLADGL